MTRPSVPYHMVQITNDPDSYLFGDMSVHDGEQRDCNRCVMTWSGYIEREENGSEA